MRVRHYAFGQFREYWTVSDNSFDYWLTGEEISQWCTENFGRQTYILPNKGEPGWSKYRETFTINRQDDLTLFLLRWGN